MKNFLLYLIKSYKKDKINVFSAQASFFIVVSAVPFAAMLLSITGILAPLLSENFGELILSFIPKSLYSSAEIILEEIQNQSGFHLISVSAIASVWASCKGVDGVCRGIEWVWQNSDTSPFIIRFLRTLWRTFLFSCIIIFSLVLFSVGKLIYAYAGQSGIILNLFFEVIINLRFVIFFVLLCLFFTALYLKLSHKKVNFFCHLPGAVFASAGWTVFTFFYSFYISFSLKRSYLYAGFGAVIFFMLWIYFCLIIILLGAEINKYLISVDFFEKKLYNSKKR